MLSLWWLKDNVQITFYLAISRPPLYGSNAPKVLSVVHVKVGPPTQDKMQYIDK
jgi:hypothetical protein